LAFPCQAHTRFSDFLLVGKPAEVWGLPSPHRACGFSHGVWRSAFSRTPELLIKCSGSLWLCSPWQTSCAKSLWMPCIP
jgi:hypothetical protein